MVTRRPTSTDVARAAGVSRATVSYVLNETPGQTISASVRQRVLEEAARVGYVRNPQARALATGQSHIILALLPEWPVEYLLRELLDEMSLALDEAGYSLVTAKPYASGRTAPLWESLRPDVVVPIEPIDDRRAETIRRSGAQLLMPDNAQRAAFDIGPELQTTHLLDLGHTAIAYASTTVRGMDAMDADRMRRSQEVAALASISFTTAPVDHTTAQEQVNAWTRSGVSGVVAFNDDTAAQVLGAALRNGLRVPDDLAVIGHDDSPIATMTFPSLSSVRVDVSGRGRYFAERVLAAARNEPLPKEAPPGVRAHLVRREST
ncbi:LacI family DNA-binding transcriptional regulator [Microbacterium trichothecenolyticum]|uniref:LacI family DNA-binding transcriptional regulator n=1 Tax=Microbacterium trichothecenolyticum TaxID=69370 RepID=UPI0035BE9783